ncbi:MAG: hypothetical protein U9R38_03285 [Candidatus Margulisiibacteriota bacterium]|nr:hypothetical protein [Candidatus Margulisiibacteriota bacterium]
MKPKLLFITVLIVFFAANILSADDAKDLTTIKIIEKETRLEKATGPVIIKREIIVTTSTSTTIASTTTSTTTTGIR